MPPTANHVAGRPSHEQLSWLTELVGYGSPLLDGPYIRRYHRAAGRRGHRRAPPPETAATLPEGSAFAEALVEIDRLFGDSGEANVVTLLFRGEALTPSGLAQMDALINEIVTDQSVAELLTATDSVISPSLLIRVLLGVEGFESVTQEDIDTVRGPSEILNALDTITGTDTDGTPVAVATIRLHDTGDERIQEAEREIHALATGHEGPLRVSTVSFVVVEDEYKKATEEGMGPLIGLAFLLIAGLILLFMRAISDLLLTLVGLLMSTIWIVGAEGWLGPNALGLTGPPNSLTTMVPIIVISLTVDYAIQIVSHYRERRIAGEGVLTAVRTGMRNVTVPLTLAAVTTIVSLLASLFSPIGIVRDFGIIAGLGVAMSLIVMLTLVPVGRGDPGPEAGDAGHAEESKTNLGRIAWCRQDRGVAGKERYANAGPLPHWSTRGNDWAGYRGHRPRVGIRHPGHPAQGLKRDGGFEHPGRSRWRFNRSGQRAYQG